MCLATVVVGRLDCGCHKYILPYAVFPEVLEKSLRILENSLKPKQINWGISEGYRTTMNQLRRDMSNNPRIYQGPRRGRDMLLLVVCGYSATRTPAIGAALSYFWEDWSAHKSI